MQPGNRSYTSRILFLVILLSILQGCFPSADTTPVYEASFSPLPSASVPASPVPVIVVDAEVQPAPSTDTPAPPVTAPPTETPVPTSTPVPFTPVSLPDVYRPSHDFVQTEVPSVLFCENENLYVAYGSFSDSAPAFYPSDNRGNVDSSSIAVDRICVVPSYAPSEVPKEDGTWMLAVYLPTQSVVAFCSEDGEWREERIMICSTGRKNHATPAGHYTIYQRYEYKLLGTSDSPCYGLWACRFKTHYLFHSVPISAEAGRDPIKGHRMTNMRKYEMLGTVASDGCIRMTVADAKWIYDLSADHTVSVWVTKDAGPVPPRPPQILWEEPYTSKKGLGWDPTDPYPDNPYLQLQNSPAPVS